MRAFTKSCYFINRQIFDRRVVNRVKTLAGIYQMGREATGKVMWEGWGLPPGGVSVRDSAKEKSRTTTGGIRRGWLWGGGLPASFRQFRA